MKYIKKPIEIEAIQFTGNNFDEIKSFTNNLAYRICSPFKNYCCIPTLEGDHMAKEGDYIIKGIEGEFYPCDEEIFKKTYDKIS